MPNALPEARAFDVPEFFRFQKKEQRDVLDAMLNNENNDYSILKEYASTQAGGTSTLDKSVADFNNDGAVDSSDAALILKAYAEKQAGKKKTLFSLKTFPDNGLVVNLPCLYYSKSVIIHFEPRIYTMHFFLIGMGTSKNLFGQGKIR